jgi:hypothetical protein
MLCRSNDLARRNARYRLSVSKALRFGDGRRNSGNDRAGLRPALSFESAVRAIECRAYGTGKTDAKEVVPSRWRRAQPTQTQRALSPQRPLRAFKSRSTAVRSRVIVRLRKMSELENYKRPNESARVPPSTHKLSTIH